MATHTIQCAADGCDERFTRKNALHRFHDSRCKDRQRRSKARKGQEGDDTPTRQPTDHWQQPMRSYRDILRKMGYDPSRFEVVGPVAHRQWDQAIATGTVQKMHHDSASIIAKDPADGDVGSALTDVLTAWSKTAQRLQKEQSKTAAVLRLAEQYYEGRETVDVKPPLRLVASNDLPPRDAHLQITDTQAGKWDARGGMDTLARYMKTLTRKALRILQGCPSRVERLFVHLTGDLIENCGMFPGHSNELDHAAGGNLVIVQILTMVDLLEDVIRALAAAVPELKVTSSPGNHGRRQPSLKVDPSSEFDNFDTMVALLLQRALSDLTNVTFDVPTDSWFTANLSRDYNIVTLHGHQAPKSFESWVLNHEASNTWGKADVVLVGHRHHPMTFNISSDITLIQSGAADPGSNYFHQKTGKASPPSQEMFFIESGEGIVQRHTIDLETVEPRVRKGVAA